ncbi:MAG: hypothetical protein ACSHX0_02825 [Akkermansiaceae bacterium]
MRIITVKDAVFPKIEEELNKRKDEAQLEVLAGIDCDEIDIANQEDLGDEDPIATIELIVQWLPETSEGMVDWFFVRNSTINSDPPEVEHGGALIAFNCEGEEPDLDTLVEQAVTQLNETVAWAEFELEEDN